MFYTIQDIIQLAKENLGIRELPPPVSDADLLERVKRSALKDFSIIYPRIEEFNIGINDQVDPGQLYANKMQGVKYNVPKWILSQFEPLNVISVDNITPSGYADVMWPFGTGFAADGVISSVAAIKAAAAVGQNIANAISFNYDSMRKIITVYNGWTSGSYHVRMTVAHDINLSTIPSSAMMTFKELVEYDIGQYIYNSLKRKNKLNTPGGDIELGIDDLADCGNKKKELIERCLEDGALDFEELDYF